MHACTCLLSFLGSMKLFAFVFDIELAGEGRARHIGIDAVAVDIAHAPR